MAITKISLYESHPDRDGYTLIHPVNKFYTSGLDKTASTLAPELTSYLGDLQEPGPDEARAVITALSAYDTFGPNKNGDAFFREDLVREDDYGDGIGVIPMYETFEHFARPYRHHNNKPHSPAYGKILRAFWNPEMDRVELVVSVDRKSASDIIDKMENYGDVATSMGFKAKYDQCVPSYALIATRNGFKAMEDVEIGDTVLTHTGEYKKVLGTKRTPFKGKRLLSFTAPGGSRPMDVTHNHPVWVVKKQDADANRWTPVFMDAEDIQEGDHLVRNSHAYGIYLQRFLDPEIKTFEFERGVYWATPIKQIDDISSTYSHDWVYNIEVEGDHTYTVENYITHNCLICGNKATKRPEYCEHARRQMLQVLPDGRIVAVRNPEGKFFDISFVGDPADLTSRAVWVNRVIPRELNKEASLWTPTGSEKGPDDAKEDVYLSSDLACSNGVCEIVQIDHEKVASIQRKLAEDKKADIVKKVDGSEQTLAPPSVVEKIRESEPALTQGALCTLSDQSEDRVSAETLTPEQKLESTLSALMLCGISPTPREAQYLALKSVGLDEDAELLHDNNILVDTSQFEPVPLPVDMGETLHQEDHVEKMASLISADDELMENRSHNTGWIVRRPIFFKRATYNPYIAGTGKGRYATSMAGSILTGRDLRRYVDDQEDPMRASKFKYAIGLIMGAQWAIRRRQFNSLAKNNPDLLARIALGPDAQANDLFQGQRTLKGALLSPRGSRGQESLAGLQMMAPMGNYVHGVGKYDFNGQSDLMQSMMAKESSFREEAKRVVNDNLYIEMNKVASASFSKEDLEFFAPDASLLKALMNSIS